MDGPIASECGLQAYSISMITMHSVLDTYHILTAR